MKLPGSNSGAVARETAERCESKGRRLTYQDYLQLPPGPRYELVEGEPRQVDSPSIYHQEIIKQLERLLREQFEDRGQGKVYLAPVDVVLSQSDVLQPDLLYIAQDRLGIIGRLNIAGAPDLIAEVLSPSTEQWDRVAKRRLYAAHGVREYWLVDPVARTVEVTVHDGSSLTTACIHGQGESALSRLLPDLRLELTVLFHE